VSVAQVHSKARHLTRFAKAPEPKAEAERSRDELARLLEQHNAQPRRHAGRGLLWLAALSLFAATIVIQIRRFVIKFSLSLLFSSRELCFAVGCRAQALSTRPSPLAPLSKGEELAFNVQMTKWMTAVAKHSLYNN
jgi:hypothetical protein